MFNDIFFFFSHSIKCPSSFQDTAPNSISARIQTAIGKTDEMGKNLGETSEPTDDLADIFISDEVLKQLRLQTEKKGKNSAKQSRLKTTKSQRKITKTPGPISKEEAQSKTQGYTKKILKSSLRGRSTDSAVDPPTLEHRDTGHADMEKMDGINNKAENNNMIGDGEDCGEITDIALPSLHSKSYLTDRGASLKKTDSLCKVCFLRNCSSLSCKEAKGIIDPLTKKEYSFKRADSSDDSGCFSNLSIQSTKSPGTETHERHLEGYPKNEQSEGLHNSCSTVPKPGSSSPGLCSACGSEPQGRTGGLCKNCIGRFRQDGIRIGALGELRAYAQSIADSVKKILSLSPKESEEVLLPSVSTEKREEQKVCIPHSDTAIVPADFQRDKYVTQVSMESRSKSLLSKSVSFDGRVHASKEETGRRSPTYWRSEEKSKQPVLYSKTSESEEEQQQKVLTNKSDTSFVDGDYFSSNDKENKTFIVRDNDRNSRVEKSERTRRKLSHKQLSRVERARTDGDLRGNLLLQSTSNKKNARDEHKKGQESRVRNRSSRTAEPDVEDYCKSSYKPQEEMNALNIFRLKVIHEGSPVDPLYTVQGKNSEEGKDRRAALIRSATAPNKNHMPKKDRANRSNTKLSMKRNKTSSQRDERSIEEEEGRGGKTLVVPEPQPESWRDEASVMAVPPFIRRRSTSYDGNKTMHFSRKELHRSISRSAFDREDEGRKQRRDSTSTEKAPAKKITEHESRFSNTHPLKITVHSKAGHQAGAASFAHPASADPFSEASKFQTLETSNKEFLYNKMNVLVPDIATDEEHKQLRESQNKPAYFQNVEYYESQDQRSPSRKEMIFIRDRSVTTFGTETYYCHIKEPDTHGFESGAVMKFDPGNIVSAFKNGNMEDTYHKQIQKYGEPNLSDDKESLWYGSHNEDRSLRCRDRSHESKSSTSFHIVTTARSSHSDVALLKHSGAWEHIQSRRQPIYSETDVDTGLIYHFAKRQTTRAHVPPFQDFTNASKDIYTMSGDVSTSASSNSAISTKSEVSDSAYTGGFFKHDPFYDNDSKISSSSSSADSPDHLYFEPEDVTKREPSEMDIYTGAIFSSSQNALSLGTASKLGDPTYDALKDGSTNNSTRPPMTRMSRRLRYRPHIDVIKFKSTDSPGEFLSKSTVPYSENRFCNVSNNSSSWSSDDNVESSSNRGAVVRKTKDSTYTDYGAGMKPEFHVRRIEKTAPTLDFFKYENQDDSSTDLLSKTPVQTCSASGNTWYSGFSVQRFDNLAQSAFRPKKRPINDNSLAWQSSDDYYTVQIRPWANKTNNCNYGDIDQESCDTNNSHFEDIYTSYCAGPNCRPPPPPPHAQEQSQDYRQSTSDKWYVDETPVNRSPTVFYEQATPRPGSPKKSSSGIYETAEAPYSPANIFGQAAYSGARAYATEVGWSENEQQYQMPSNNSYAETLDGKQLSPERANLGEKYSYFQYVSNESPAHTSLLRDEDTYSYDSTFAKVESVIREIKKVGGIVCRENVANKEDYAEDVNRDLEQGGWMMPINFRHEDKLKYPSEISTTRPSVRPEIAPMLPDPVYQGRQPKPLEESTYNQNRIYDNVGARNKWREMSKKQEPEVSISRESSYKSHQAGDIKRQEYAKTTAWNPPDQIPERARGKRTIINTPKPTILEDTPGQKPASSKFFSCFCF